ncbi:MAG: MFS transporter [Acidobacteria bacterium]|nr:MFS transporter [Acidobacteriota bacterium]
MNKSSSKFTILLLSLGHFFSDCYSSILGPLLPLIVDRLHLSLAQAGLLAGTLTFSSSIMQPAYGYLSDRFRSRFFSVLGPATAAVFLTLVGMAPSPLWLALFLVLGGMGLASFHPQSTALSAEASGRRRGLGVSIFITSGSIGYALGPVFISGALMVLSPERLYWAALPGIVMSLGLMAFGPALPSRAERSQGERLVTAWRAVAHPLAILFVLGALRSAIQLAFTNFLPLYFVQEGQTLPAASRLLSLFLLAGGLGGFAGGMLADRVGGKAVIAFSMLASTPLLLGFLATDGAWSWVLLAAAGAILLFTVPVNVVMAQELVHQSSGTVSALMMGFAWGTGGLLFVPLMGSVADRIGLEAALSLISLLPLPGFGLSLLLPRIPKHVHGGIGAMTAGPYGLTEEVRE